MVAILSGGIWGKATLWSETSSLKKVPIISDNDIELVPVCYLMDQH